MSHSQVAGQASDQAIVMGRVGTGLRDGWAYPGNYIPRKGARRFKSHNHHEVPIPTLPACLGPAKKILTGDSYVSAMGMTLEITVVHDGERITLFGGARDTAGAE